MSGNAAIHVGLAIASYEWMAAITLVVVAFCFLPYFLRAGIYTMPEFLEYRFNSAARFIMAAGTVLIYLLLLGAVTYFWGANCSDVGPAIQRGYSALATLVIHRCDCDGLRGFWRLEGLGLGRRVARISTDLGWRDHHVSCVQQTGRGYRSSHGSEYRDW